jgi:iron(III) transport system substrate-binding protein
MPATSRKSADAAHFIAWKRDGLLEAYLPEEVAKPYPPQHRDIDGMFASWRIYLSVIAYNPGGPEGAHRLGWAATGA